MIRFQQKQNSLGPTMKPLAFDSETDTRRGGESRLQAREIIARQAAKSGVYRKFARSRNISNRLDVGFRQAVPKLRVPDHSMRQETRFRSSREPGGDPAPRRKK